MDGGRRDKGRYVRRVVLTPFCESASGRVCFPWPPARPFVVSGAGNLDLLSIVARETSNCMKKVIGRTRFFLSLSHTPCLGEEQQMRPKG